MKSQLSQIRCPINGVSSLSGKLLVLALVTLLLSWLAPNRTANAVAYRQELSTTIIDLAPGTLPFPDFTNITDQFASQGAIFSADDSDLPPEFQRSLGPQENLILDRSFFNLFRLNFAPGTTVERVSVSFRDRNTNAQVHTLTAFDRAGNVVDRATFTDTDMSLDGFTLTVSSCNGIAFIVAIENPLGAERVERIEFTSGGGCFDACLQDDSNGNLLQFNSTTGDYQFTNCSGFTLSGTATLSRRGSVITLESGASDRRVMARIDTAINRATASIQVFAQGMTFTIADRNTMNNSCTCR